MNLFQTTFLSGLDADIATCTEVNCSSWPVRFRRQKTSVHFHFLACFHFPSIFDFTQSSLVWVTVVLFVLAETVDEFVDAGFSTFKKCSPLNWTTILSPLFIIRNFTAKRGGFRPYFYFGYPLRYCQRYRFVLSQLATTVPSLFIVHVLLLYVYFPLTYNNRF